MIDIETQRPLAVSTDGDSGPYLMLPLDQLDDVRRILQQHGIHHIVVPDAIKLDGRPFIATIDFGRSADARRVQEALDAA